MWSVAIEIAAVTRSRTQLNERSETKMYKCLATYVTIAPSPKNLENVSLCSRFLLYLLLEICSINRETVSSTVLRIFMFQRHWESYRWVGHKLMWVLLAICSVVSIQYCSVKVGQARNQKSADDWHYAIVPWILTIDVKASERWLQRTLPYSHITSQRVMVDAYCLVYTELNWNTTQTMETANGRYV